MQKSYLQPSVMLKWLMFCGAFGLLSACGGGGDNNTGTTVTDTTPAAFSFTAQTNTPLNQLVTTPAVTVSGINSATAISVSNGEFAINGGNFTSSNGSVSNGNTVVVRHMASAQNATTTSSILTIGGVSATFSSTTVPAATGNVEALVNITFPLGKAKTNSNTIRVTGTANSTLPLANLSVNGTAATIADLSASAPGKVSAALSPPDYAVSWYADVPLTANADNTLTVAVTDDAGNRNDKAATVQVSRKFAPSTFSYDATANRLYAVVENNDLVSIDLQSYEYHALSNLQSAHNLVFAQGTGKVFYASALNNNVTLYSTDIETGIVNQVHTFSVALQNSQFINLTDIVYADVTQTLYFMLVYPSSDRALYLHELYGFNLNSGVLSLISSDSVGNGPRLETNKLLAVNNMLLGFTWEREGLISIDPATGNRSLLIDGIAGHNMVLAKGETDNIIYTAGFAGVFRIDLTAQEITNISPEAEQDIYVTEQIQSLALDAQGNRLLLSDSTAGLVLAVDLTTGERSKVLSSGVGDGRYLLMPQFIATDTTTDTVYLLDANTNANQALLEVNLSTANRSFVTDSNALPDDIAADLLLDKARNRLIAIYYNQIVAIDLTSRAVSTLKTNSGAAGIAVQTFNGGVIDSVNNKLLISAFHTDNTLIELDLITNQHQLLSITPANTNAPVSGIVDIALNADGSKVYLLSQHTGVIHQLDRNSGVAQVIVNECLNASGMNMLDTDYTTLHNIIYNPYNDSVLITANAVLEVNLADNSCVAYGNNDDSYIDVSLTSDNQLLATEQNKLLHYDRINNQSVVISR
ncbi:hypothetical protein [Rheinheimera sp. EpRS3]|uniref:hypothetical protein n=1 Tax=Rheinheimera sp. EpRS3 TaxID=1712383 RepID=UPI00074AD96A|nr:hypothetical protein [Rheinheimera sp. EpRS3]KUM53979.1 hypothetical protein AR688_11540 [Rheinheimera sp. EpRS3]